MEFQTLLDAIAYYAEMTPDKVCLIDASKGDSITYAEFWQKIRAFAARLHEADLKQGENAVVRVGPLIETFVAQFAINLAGGVYCPAEKHMKPLKVLEMLDYFDSTLLISTENIEQAGFEGKFIELSSACEYGEPPEAFNFPAPDDMCAIIFTTGTTGKSKGVMINHKAYVVGSKARRDAYGVKANDVYCWMTPIDRGSGSRQFGVALTAGCTAIHIDGVVFVNSFFQSISKYGITVMHLQSFALSIILKAAPKDFAEYKNQIRVMYFGGGSVSERQKQQIQAILPNTQLFVHYSATEVSAISYYEFSRYPGKANCVGKPYPGTKLCFVDEAGVLTEQTSKDNPGIIACNGQGAMMGYWKDPELAAKTIVDGWIIMADVGYIDEEGFIYLMGRRDDVIVSGGHKIAPYEIESIASLIEDVEECACVPMPNDVLGMTPKLYVVMKNNTEFSAKKINDFLSERLETYKLPRVIREIESLPRVAGSQKIDRKELLTYD